MRWAEEKEFINIAKFLGRLFSADSEEISERFVNLDEMFVLKFIDEDQEIHGVIVSIRDNKEPSIVELIYTAFELDFDFEMHNPFQRLINYAKSEYIEYIYTNTYISENSFVNVDLDHLSNFLTTHERVTMNLSEKKFKDLWYDETGEKLDLQKYDYLKPNQSVKLSKEKKSARFKIIDMKGIDTKAVASLQRSVYSNVDYEDTVQILSSEKSNYNSILTSRLINNYYGELDEEISVVAITDKGLPAGYVIGLKPFLKSGFLVDIAIDPKYQGYGLGKVLFRNAIIKYFLKYKCENVGLSVTFSNEKAINMYLNNGFEIVRSGKEGIIII